MDTKKTILNILGWITFVGLFAGLGYAIGSSDLLSNLTFENNTERIVALLGTIVMVHIALAIHELGHLLTGLVQGFRFELYVIGFLGIRRDEDKIKVYFNTNFGYYGGVAATSPVDDSEGNANKFANVLLAGPGSSLLFAVVCFAVGAIVDPPLQKFIVNVGGLSSLVFFLATTLPSRSGMFFTDRKRYQRLSKPGKDREVEIAMLNIMGALSKHGSYQHVAYDDIQLIISDDSPFIKFFGLFNASCYQLEHNGSIEQETLATYQSTSKQLPKHTVKAFDLEIEKYKTKISEAN